MQRRKRLFGSLSPFSLGLLAACGVAALTPVGTAHAQAAQPQPARQREERDQRVVFDDDLLDGNLDTPFGDPVFSEHLRPGRVTLIRPRTSFVPELYESVENI